MNNRHFANTIKRAMAAQSGRAQPRDGVKLERGAKPPGDIDGDNMNGQRAAWALAALEAFMEATGTDAGDAISDLVCDLVHLTDRQPKRFGKAQDMIARGLRAYAQEIEDF